LGSRFWVWGLVCPPLVGSLKNKPKKCEEAFVKQQPKKWGSNKQKCGLAGSGSGPGVLGLGWGKWGGGSPSHTISGFYGQGAVGVCYWGGRGGGVGVPKTFFCIKKVSVGEGGP